jgi:lysophospholipase L1-like esterase
VEREETFPSVLERIWNGAAPAEPVEVLNFGVPGLNSSKLRQRFRTLLDEFRPDLVLVLVGSNDPVSVPAPLDDEDATNIGIEEILWRFSRLYRLLYMISTSGAVGQLRIDADGSRVVRSAGREIELTATGRIRTQEDWVDPFQDNLRAMARHSRASGATFVLLTYASKARLYSMASRAMHPTADEIPIIDVGRQFAFVCADGLCPEVFLPDQHPSPGGYELYAAIVWRGLVRLGIAPRNGSEADAFAGLRPDVLVRLERLRPMAMVFEPLGRRP